MGYDLSMLQDPKFQDVPRDLRLGGAGIDGLSAAMYAAGVLEFDSKPPEDFEGGWPPAGMSDKRGDEIYYHLTEGGDPRELEPPPTADELEAFRQYHAALEIYLQTRSPLDGKVPAYKFGSNSNWHVVPEECALIADAMDKLLEDLPENLAEEMEWDGDEDALVEWLEDWRDYNRVAVSHGGYRVG